MLILLSKAFFSSSCHSGCPPAPLPALSPNQVEAQLAALQQQRAQQLAPSRLYLPIPWQPIIYEQPVTMYKASVCDNSTAQVRGDGHRVRTKAVLQLHAHRWDPPQASQQGVCNTLACLSCATFDQPCRPAAHAVDSFLRALLLFLHRWLLRREASSHQCLTAGLSISCRTGHTRVPAAAAAMRGPRCGAACTHTPLQTRCVAVSQLRLDSHEQRQQS